MMKTQKKQYATPNMEVHQMGLLQMLNASGDNGTPQVLSGSAQIGVDNDAKRRSSGLSGNGDWNLPF